MRLAPRSAFDGFDGAAPPPTAADEAIEKRFAAAAAAALVCLSGALGSLS